MTNKNLGDKGQGQIKDKILIKDRYSDKRPMLWQITNAVTNDKYCDKGQLIDWKQNFTASHVFDKKTSSMDAGHLTKDSNTLLLGN